MILQNNGDEFHYGGVKYVVGEEIIGTSQSEYENLVGYITEIRDGEDKETENDTPDIYCSFEAPFSPHDIKKLEEVFSDLYDQPKTLDEICLDMVIMAPEMIMPTRLLNTPNRTVTVYIVHQDWAVDGDGGMTSEVFLDYAAAKRELHSLLKEEFCHGCISIWISRDNFVSESSEDEYEAYINGEYLTDHYRIVIEKQQISISDQVIRQIGDLSQKEDFLAQIEGWDELDELTNEQYAKFISDPRIPDLISDALSKNDSYWEAYWESVSAVANRLLREAKKENQYEHI